MDNVMEYIFESLRKNDMKLYNHTRWLNKQHGFNRRVTVFAFVTTANLIVAGIDRRDQAMRIRKLEKEVEELKHLKGEEKGCDD